MEFQQIIKGDKVLIPKGTEVFSLRLSSSIILHDDIRAEVILKPLRGHDGTDVVVQKIKMQPMENKWMHDADFGMMEVTVGELVEWKVGKKVC